MGLCRAASPILVLAVVTQYLLRIRTWSHILCLHTGRWRCAHCLKRPLHRHQLLIHRHGAISPLGDRQQRVQGRP